MHAYGWIPDDDDPRDRIYTADPPRVLPTRVDLRPKLPPWIWNQRKIGSCTCQAACCAALYAGLRGPGAVVEPSRLFPYWNARLSKAEDNGARIRTVIKSIIDYGLCDEALWPYKEELLYQQPSDEAYAQAQDHQAIVYESLRNNISDMRAAIADEWPVIFGVPIFASFETAYVTRTGRVPMPNEDKEELKGYHAMLAAGYDLHSGIIIARNSWGPEWGDHGHCYLPEQFVKVDADDLWVIKRME